MDSKSQLCKLPLESRNYRTVTGDSKYQNTKILIQHEVRRRNYCRSSQTIEFLSSLTKLIVRTCGLNFITMMHSSIVVFFSLLVAPVSSFVPSLASSRVSTAQNALADKIFGMDLFAPVKCPMLQGACGSGRTPILFCSLSFDC
jgi:hypothetical protein